MATDQGVRYVVSLQDVNVTSGLKNMEGSAMSTERSIASLNDTLRSLAGAFGIGLGLHAIVNFGKDAVQGAADYETAVKRIKFASENLVEGGKNMAFITAEADKFKIPLQSATDAYGKFLAMLAGSDIESDRVRKLHDQLLLIGKVKGLGDGQMDAAVMNLGKMLESGSLDARHFRPLEQQLSGIGAFVARELGITVHQLALLRNAGKMTTIDPKVLLSAIEKQAASLEKFLPESTTTIQSQINELDNAWLKFKNDLVYDNIGELKDLFETLKKGVGWLEAHREAIKKAGGVALEVGKIWLGYKIAMGAVNLATSTYTAYMAGYLGKSAAVVSATEAQAIAMNALAASMERVAYASEIMAGASLSGVVGLGATGIPLASAGGGVLAAEGAVAGGAGALGGVSLVGGALLVAIAAASLVALANVFQPKGTKGVSMADYNAIYHGDKPANVSPQFNQFSAKQFMGWNPKTGEADYGTKNVFQRDSSNMNHLAEGQLSLIQKLQKAFPNASIPGKQDNNKIGAPSGGGGSKITAPNDHITGQRVVTYNISIKEINGIKENNVAEGGEMNTKEVAEELRDIIIGIVNDSQIQGDR